MCRERDVASARAVVAGPVQPLAVVLDRFRLLGCESEPLEQACGEPRRAAHRLPIVRVQQARFSERGSVDRDLAEVMKPARPPEAAYIALRKPERLCQLAHALRDALRMTVGRAVALVDDVREGLECRCDLPARPIRRQWSRSSRISAGTRSAAYQRFDSAAIARAAPRVDLGCGGEEVRLDHRRPGGNAVDERLHGREGHPEDREPEQVVGEHHRARGGAGEDVRVAAGEPREPQREGADDGLAPRISGEPPDREAPGCADEQRRPGAEHESSGGDDRRRDGEAVGDGLVGAEIVVSAMQELGGDHRRREQRKRAHRREHEHMPMDRRALRVP